MRVSAETTFQIYSRNSAQSAGAGRAVHPFRAGVSLHSHTMFSEESLGMIPRYTARVPYLGSAIRRQEAEYATRRGSNFDFNRAFWTPPLAPRQAYRLEEKQIQRRFGLPAHVSLTDHDDMRAAQLLRVLDRFAHAPISTEWTIPFGPTFFHLGVHNLPAEHARALESEMAAYTRQPSAGLETLLATLNSFEHVLLVLNHPLWDEKGIGADLHRRALGQLLARYGEFFHALELNGLRSSKENAEVVRLAAEIDLPAISGGDRHGREPNAILNLTRAETFAGFVEEIRYERRSHIVFMPQYREPLKVRVLRTMADIVREYPENAPGRRLWNERVFYREPGTENIVPLASVWADGGPLIVRQFVRAMQLAGKPQILSALRATIGTITAFSEPLP